MAKKKYEIGDKVEHKLFGKGQILEIKGFAADAKLTIDFYDKDTKVIISKYVKLVKK